MIAGLALLPLLIAGIMLLFKKSTRRCPGCGAMTPGDAARCRHCGLGFESGVEPSYRDPPDEPALSLERERLPRPDDPDEEPESSPYGAVSCVLCGRAAPAADCVMVPERGPLCSACIETIIAAATPAERRH
jgi:hypothetical protein